MAEYSKEKLYFLKLPSDFHKSHELNIIKSKEHGNEMAFFLIQLMCEATPWQGYLRYSPDIPYDNEDLASITNTNVEIVNQAMKLFKKYHIIKITKDKSIYIPMVEEMTISKTKGADYKERLRTNQKGDKRGTLGGQVGDKRGTNVSLMGDKCPQDNKILDNKNIYNKNFVSNDTRLININNKKSNLLITKKSSAKIVPQNDTNENEDILKTALDLKSIGENIDLKWFANDEALYQEFLKRVEEQKDD